jgi:MoxR-like ATPase
VLAAKVRALLAGRPHVSRDDLQVVLRPALRHRVVPTFEADGEGVTVDDLAEGFWREAEKRAGA